jgi:hypothetical protein
MNSLESGTTTHATGEESEHVRLPRPMNATLTRLRSRQQAATRNDRRTQATQRVTDLFCRGGRQEGPEAGTYADVSSATTPMPCVRESAPDPGFRFEKHEAARKRWCRRGRACDECV